MKLPTRHYKPQWKQEAEGSARQRLEKMMEEHEGLGVSTRFADRAYWLEDVDWNGHWYKALRDIDTRGDVQPLLALLRAVVPPAIGPHLDDLLLKRYQLKRRPGKQRIPSYDATETAITLAVAVSDVRSKRRNKVPLEDAIRQVASNYGLDEKTVELAYRGQHGSLRRSPARRLP